MKQERVTRSRKAVALEYFTIAAVALILFAIGLVILLRTVRPWAEGGFPL